jgi:DNA repair exonuclease SbcCD ATPase subunit
MSESELDHRASIEVDDIGGIDHATAKFEPGVTILTGRNATNRTSFLQALMAALGSNTATLKADADEGSVTLDIDGETYTRTLSRQGSTVTITGDPYLDDADIADRFAFLLENNDCRRAIARGDDLRELIMEPVDTDQIERQILSLENERDELNSKIRAIEKEKQNLPDLEQKKMDIESELSVKEDEIEDKKKEMEDIDRSVDKTREEKEKLDSKVDELGSLRNNLSRVHNQMSSEEESIAALEDESEELHAERDDLSPVPENKLAEIDQDIQRLRGQIDAIDQSINELQSVVNFNENVIDDGDSHLLDQPDDDDSGNVTDQLLDGAQTVTCWTCGSEVETDQIEQTLEELRTLRSDKMQQRQDLEQEIEELQSEKRDLEQQRNRYQTLQQKLDDTERELEDRQETLEELRERESDLEAEIETLEAEVEQLQEQEYSEILELNEELNTLEFEHEQLESDLEDIKNEIDRIEAQVEELDELEAQRDELRSELEDLRSHVETLQEQAVEEFNDRMETVLDLLEYENLERIWIERTRETVRDGRRKVEQDRFDLHVVRSGDSGAVFEDTVEHLSESEREVTGLVFALAGYLVHELYEAVPFMLLDSVEAIDPERIAHLIDYFGGHADYLVVALLEDDAAALNDDYTRISNI